MKIALFGYGKMGKTIEQIALQKGHTIVLKTSGKSSLEKIIEADVAIDFSTPKNIEPHKSTGVESGDYVKNEAQKPISDKQIAKVART